MRKPTRVKTLHFRVVNIRRNKARPDNAVKASPTFPAKTLYDEKEHKTHTYERRSSVVECAIVAPDNAPDWMRDENQKRAWQRFGNEIEKADREESPRPKRAQQG